MRRPVSILSILWLVALMTLVTVGPALAAPPPNDDPAGEPVPGCAFNGNFSRSIWYVFTPPYSTQYVVATDVSGTTVADTVLAIYTSAGGAGGPFTQVACDDDGGTGFQSRLTTSLAAGTTYWIQASKYGPEPPAAGATAIQLMVDTAWPLSIPLTTAFTYQGALNRDGAPVTGTCDLRFTLFDAATGGIQRGLPQTLPGVAVANGLFTVDIDFGDTFRGDRLWLETAVQCAGECAGLRCPGGAGQPLYDRRRHAGAEGVLANHGCTRRSLPARQPAGG